MLQPAPGKHVAVAVHARPSSNNSTPARQVLPLAHVAEAGEGKPEEGRVCDHRDIVLGALRQRMGGALATSVLAISVWLHPKRRSLQSDALQPHRHAACLHLPKCSPQNTGACQT